MNLKKNIAIVFLCLFSLNCLAKPSTTPPKMPPPVAPDASTLPPPELNDTPAPTVVPPKPVSKHTIALEFPKNSEGDSYVRWVNFAEETDDISQVNFYKMRMAFLNSPVRQNVNNNSAKLRELRQKTRQAISLNDTDGAINNTMKILAIDYVDMFAHKILRQGCHIKGDEACEEHEHAIEFGLLNSLMDNKDPSSCLNSPVVISIDEEYFFMEMAGLGLKNQTLVQNGNICDQMDTFNSSGEDKTIYFNINNLLIAEDKDLKEKTK